MNSLTVTPIKTRVFNLGDCLVDFILESVTRSLIQERMILAVTSKIVSLSENRIVPRNQIDKTSLVHREADHFLGEIGHGVFLTIKHGLFIPSAGIDESNSQFGDFILYPENPFLSAERLWTKLRAEWNLDKLGIVMTDSHTTPLRKGVTGISLAHWGFCGVRSLIGEPDLFGRKLQMTNMNLADGLASSAVMMMGEGNECQPLALISGVALEFKEETKRSEVAMPIHDDLYYPFFQNLR
jgi:dihydrofolate synthase / folylpolyglutamate synthase